VLQGQSRPHPQGCELRKPLAKRRVAATADLWLRVGAVGPSEPPARSGRAPDTNRTKPGWRSGDLAATPPTSTT